MPSTSTTTVLSPQAGPDREQFARDGAIWIKGYLSSDAVRGMLDMYDFVYATDGYTKALQERDDDSARSRLDLMSRLGYVPTFEAKTALQSLYPRGFEVLEETCESLTRLAEAVAPARLTTQVAKDLCLMKRIAPATSQRKVAAWHRDSDGGGMIKVTKHGANLWMPLCDVGVDYASLEIVVGSHNKMRTEPNAIEDKVSVWIDDDWIRGEFAPEAITVPHMAAGDVLIFDEHLLHRTQLGVPADGRSTFEFRVAYS